MGRGISKIDKILAEARDAQLEADRLADEAHHLMLDVDLDLDENDSSSDYPESPVPAYKCVPTSRLARMRWSVPGADSVVCGSVMAPSTPVRRPLKVKSRGRGSTRTGGKPRRQQRTAGSDVEALHGKLGDALLLLGSMLD